MTSKELRQKFLKFFEDRGHKHVPSSSLLSDDPSVLLTSAGMQQFKPYYTGDADPIKDFNSKNTVSVQKSFRTSDIDEVGDESHLTFFEMLGNFSFGGYFKKEAIEYGYDFITKELELKIDYVSIFEGDDDVPPDTKSEQIWKDIDPNIEVRRFNKKENFWGPTGNEGPCGPTTEIYVDGLEVWNIVFNEFYCNADKSLTKLESPGVDTGMGLERLAMVAQGKDSIFETDLFSNLIQKIVSGEDKYNKERIRRIVADHVRGMAFLITDDVVPSNTGAGYILRRLMRRVISYQITNIEELFDIIVSNYKEFYPQLDIELIKNVYKKESEKFKLTLDKGLRELNKLESVSTKDAFNLFQTYGLPYEVMKDSLGDRSNSLSREEFDKEIARHQKVSRAGAHTFKGGLADDDPQTVKLHTAHHLLLAALQNVLGPDVKQKGSNITKDRLRIDFSWGEKLTDTQKEEIENIVNQKVKDGLDVIKEEMPKEEAEGLGAEMEFGTKYGDTVSVYIIKNKDGSPFSLEFCGGPHVQNTAELGRLRIAKESATSVGVRRIKAILEHN